MEDFICENCDSWGAHKMPDDGKGGPGYLCIDCVSDYAEDESRYMGSDSDFSDHALGIDY